VSRTPSISAPFLHRSIIRVLQLIMLCGVLFDVSQQLCLVLDDLLRFEDRTLSVSVGISDSMAVEIVNSLSETDDYA
jgi:hypothetical protein